MTSVSIQQAQANLPDLVHQLTAQDAVVITENGRPVAHIVLPHAPGGGRKLGTLKGTVKQVAADFDAPLEQFSEYTP